MKKFLFFLIILLTLIAIYLNFNTIEKYANIIINETQNITIPVKNEYSKAKDFSFVEITEDYAAKDRKSLYNIIYTYLDSGMKDFTFKCHHSYQDCTKDIEELIEDRSTLTIINYYVHPFNSFSKINIRYNSIGSVEIKIIPNYTKEEINLLNERIEKVSKELDLDNLYQTNKIDFLKAIHDYIINNAKYDKSNTSGNNDGQYKSATAYGPLIEGFAICSGYSDALSLFMHKYDLKNYKITSEKHAWNTVFINGYWRHIDLTWDDPVSSTGEDVITHKFFVIDTKTLEELDLTEHTFNKVIYKEMI